MDTGLKYRTLSATVKILWLLPCLLFLFSQLTFPGPWASLDPRSGGSLLPDFAVIL